jgi:glycerol uptake facilitator-like aquaporin
MPLLTLLSNLYRSIGPIFPPGLVTCLASAFVGDAKHLHAFRREFVGTLLMIGFTFSPGKWIGRDSLIVAWIAHALGVIASDRIGGGPHVNPAVTASMYALGKCTYTEGYVRVMGSMAGGLVAFPLYSRLSETLGLTPLGGPEYDPKDDAEGLLSGSSEFVAMVLLMFLIYAVNWELNFGKYHYWIKQTLTALGIRYLIETFPRAGPAINPMLATTWYIFRHGTYPVHPGFYFTYWISSVAGALFASCVYVIYAGGTVFGMTLPLGPIRGDETTTTTESKKKM